MFTKSDGFDDKRLIIMIFLCFVAHQWRLQACSNSASFDFPLFQNPQVRSGTPLLGNSSELGFYPCGAHVQQLRQRLRVAPCLCQDIHARRTNTLTHSLALAWRLPIPLGLVLHLPACSLHLQLPLTRPLG